MRGILYTVTGVTSRAADGAFWLVDATPPLPGFALL